MNNIHRDTKKKKNTGKIIVIIILAVIICGGLWMWYQSTRSVWYCENGLWVTSKETDEPMPTEMCPGAELSGERMQPDSETLAIDSQKVAEGINIRVNNPYVNESIVSPLKISGEAKDWYFDGAFDVLLMSEDGTVFARGAANATDEVTEGVYIKFETELEFDAGGRRAGDIIFQKNAKAKTPGSFSFPVFFE